MKQPIAFLNIRLRQIRSELISMGFVYAILIVFAFIVLVGIFVVSFSELNNVLVTGAILLFILFGIHLRRNDKTFIKVNIENPGVVYFVEYSFFTLLFVIIAIVRLSSLLPLLFYIPMFLICLNTKATVKSNAFRNPVFFIDSRNYEWLSGFRKLGWVLILLFLCSLFLTPVIYAPMILLWLALFLVSSFYEEHESRIMLESFELPAKKLILFKIKQHSLLILIPYAIILFAATIFHPERWWIYMLFLFYSVMMISVFVVTKYSVWGIPGMHRSVSITNSLCMIGFFIPFLLPLPIIITALNYKKSISKLSPILYDYN